MKYTVMIVGNGPSLLGSGLGNTIDSCDEVIRFNQFSLDPKHHADVGTRCTIWSTFQLREKTIPGLREIWSPTFACPGFNWERRWEELCAMAKKLGCEIIRISDDFAQTVSDQMGLVLPKKPTSGAVVIAHALVVFSPARILACGFDAFQGKQKHYWASRKVSEDRRLPKITDVEAEKRFFNSLSEQGLVEFISHG